MVDSFQNRVATPLWGKKFKDFKDIQGDFYQFFKEILPFTGKFWKKFQEFQGDFISIGTRSLTEQENWDATRVYQIKSDATSAIMCLLHIGG